MLTTRVFLLLVAILRLHLSVHGIAIPLSPSEEEMITPSSRLNVLFIMSDDLRPELSIYKHDHVKTPNFERLAQRGIIFDRAYSQLPVCFPSRHSLLTGLRPDTLQITTWTDTQHPYVESIFSILVRNKYHSAGLGKLFHHPRNGSAEFPNGRWDGKWYKYQGTEETLLNATVTPDDTRPLESFRDHMIATEGIIKIKELHKLSQDKTGRPWIVSIGFKLPHTQYHVPRRVYDLYNDSRYLESKLNLTQQENIFPVGAPRMNYRCCANQFFIPMVAEGRQRTSEHLRLDFYGKMRIPNRYHKELLQGYLAGISFLDEQLGRVLDVMDELELWENTIVVFTADHGMSVGEKGMWEKYTLFEEVTRVPLIIADPRYHLQHGNHYDKPVELVDIVPTLLDLLSIRHIPVLCPRSFICLNFEGRSRAGIVRQGRKQPDLLAALARLRAQRQGSHKKNSKNDNGNDKDNGNDNDNVTQSTAINEIIRNLKQKSIQVHQRDGIPVSSYLFDNSAQYAVSQMRRCRYGKKEHHMSTHPEDVWSAICGKHNKDKGSLMGYSLRSEGWRYTAWFHYNQQLLMPDWTRAIVAEELYSHRGAGINDLWIERQNMALHADVQVQDIMQEHRLMLLDYLKASSFSFKDAIKKTVAYWRNAGYDVNENDCRVVGLPRGGGKDHKWRRKSGGG